MKVTLFVCSSQKEPRLCGNDRIYQQVRIGTHFMINIKGFKMWRLWRSIRLQLKKDRCVDVISFKEMKDLSCPGILRVNWFRLKILSFEYQIMNQNQESCKVIETFEKKHQSYLQNETTKLQQWNSCLEHIQ